jgi:hypothetical protein
MFIKLIHVGTLEVGRLAKVTYDPNESFLQYNIKITFKIARSLKGVWHEIFNFRFFMNQFPPGP